MSNVNKFLVSYDAYSLAGRLLEGVIFDVDIAHDRDAQTLEVVSVKLRELYVDYVRSLGANDTVKHWEKEVKDDIASNLPWSVFDLENADIPEPDVEALIAKYDPKFAESREANLKPVRVEKANGGAGFQKLMSALGMKGPLN